MSVRASLFSLLLHDAAWSRVTQLRRRGITSQVEGRPSTSALLLPEVDCSLIGGGWRTCSQCTDIAQERFVTGKLAIVGGGTERTILIDAEQLVLDSQV